VGCIVEDVRVDAVRVIEACKESLPAYMVPSKIVVLPSFPLNANGKVDRAAIQKMLDAGKTHR
jgi:pyochelin synthetase